MLLSEWNPEPAPKTRAHSTSARASARKPKARKPRNKPLCPACLTKHIEHAGTRYTEIVITPDKTIARCVRCNITTGVVHVRTYFTGAETLLDEMGTLIDLEPPY